MARALTMAGDYVACIMLLITFKVFFFVKEIIKGHEGNLWKLTKCLWPMWAYDIFFSLNVFQLLSRDCRHQYKKKADMSRALKCFIFTIQVIEKSIFMKKMSSTCISKMKHFQIFDPMSCLSYLEKIRWKKISLAHL